jgi:hypothetical protein
MKDFDSVTYETRRPGMNTLSDKRPPQRKEAGSKRLRMPFLDAPEAPTLRLGPGTPPTQC